MKINQLRRQIIINSLFYKRVSGFFTKWRPEFFSFNLLLVKNWFISFTTFFGFDWNRKNFIKKVIKGKRETKHPFVDRVFNYSLTKFHNNWSNIAVFRAHGRLYSQSFVKILATKHTPMLPLNCSRCLLCNMLIQHICLASFISLFLLFFR